MNLMMDYEINLQSIKKRSEEMMKKKQSTLLTLEQQKQKRFEQHMNLLAEKD